jgi:hypothetical protein
MIQIRIDTISGSTAFPMTVSMADVYGNNRSVIATITGGTVPPTVTLNNSVSGVSIPSIFNFAPQIMLILTDNNGCEVFHILDCTFGCAFEITIEEVVCTFNIDIQNESCAISVEVSSS